MGAFFDHRNVQPVGDFAPGHAGLQLRQAAIVGFDRDVTGLAHEFDFLRAFDKAHFGQRGGAVFYLRLG